MFPCSFFSICGIFETNFKEWLSVIGIVVPSTNSCSSKTKQEKNKYLTTEKQIPRKEGFLVIVVVANVSAVIWRLEKACAGVNWYNFHIIGGKGRKMK